MFPHQSPTAAPVTGNSLHLLCLFAWHDVYYRGYTYHKLWGDICITELWHEGCSG